MLPLLILPLAVWAQGPAPEKSAVWDSLHRQIIYRQGTDSLFSIPLDKSFWAGLNHEKKKKKKTIRYRLARYAEPIGVEPVPVVITNNNSLLVLRGWLQGDTNAFFSLMLAVENEVPVLEVLVPKISVNALSFHLKPLRANGIPQPISLVKSTELVSQKRKRNSRRIILYGNIYRVAFTGQ